MHYFKCNLAKKRETGNMEIHEVYEYVPKMYISKMVDNKEIQRQ